MIACDNGSGPITAGPLTIHKPLGGETFTIGDTVKISWAEDASISGVVVKLYTNKGLSNAINLTAAVNGMVARPDTFFTWIIGSENLSPAVTYKSPVDTCYITLAKYGEESVFSKSALFTVRQQ